MKIRQVELTDVERKALDHGYKHGKTASYRKRCHIILLKSDGRIAKDIAQITDTNIQSVYNWLNRYDAEGIQGLQTKAGQGRPRAIALQKAKEGVKYSNRAIKGDYYAQRPKRVFCQTQ